MSVSLSSRSSACSLVYILFKFSTCWIITSTALPIRLSWHSHTQDSIKFPESKSKDCKILFCLGKGISTSTLNTPHDSYLTWWIAPNISERLDTLVMDWMRISRFFWSLRMISMDWLSSSHKGVRAWEEKKKGQAEILWKQQQQQKGWLKLVQTCESHLCETN